MSSHEGFIETVEIIITLMDWSNQKSTLWLIILSVEHHKIILDQQESNYILVHTFG